MDYQLICNYGEQGADVIAANGLTVWIVRTVFNYPVTNAPLPVAWISFLPNAGTNVIQWGEDYFVYETAAVLNAGSMITMDNMIAAQVGSLYAYRDDAFYLGTGSSATNFDIGNEQTGDALGFGLAQQATVDGRIILAPVCGMDLLSGQNTSLMPTVMVSVFVASIAGDKGVVLAQVPGNACVVTFSPLTSVTLDFDSQNLTFSISN